jgi:hypothetical protein
MEFEAGTPGNQEHRMVCPECGHEQEPSAEDLANNQEPVEPDHPSVEEAMRK